MRMMLRGCVERLGGKRGGALLRYSFAFFLLKGLLWSALLLGPLVTSWW
jgi:hypothetical protein